VQDLAKRLERTEVRFLRFNRKGPGQRAETDTNNNEGNSRLSSAARRGESLAATLYVFMEALRERPGTLPIADFQDLINEMAHFPQSPCIRSKPSGVLTGGSVFCP
jgi:hypothetical protein